MFSIGYACPLPDDEACERQIAALGAAGVQREHLYVEKLGDWLGNKGKRPKQLQNALLDARPYDILVVEQIDCLGWSTKSVADLLEQLSRHGVYLAILNSGINTRDPEGKLAIEFMCTAFRQKEEDRRRKTILGVARARREGRKGGRPRALDDAAKSLARTLISVERLSMATVAERLGVSRTTLYSAGLRDFSKPSKRPLKK